MEGVYITPLMDFLVLGKIPDFSQCTSQSPIRIWGEFAEVLEHCMLFGESDAIDFLWRQSGLNPNDCIVTLNPRKINENFLNELHNQCAEFRGPRFNLGVNIIDPVLIPDLADVIRQGKINTLSLVATDLQSESLNCLAATFGQVGEELTVKYATFDMQSEKSFAESLAGSTSLKKMRLDLCDLGPSKGMNFVHGMSRNKSVTALTLFRSPIEESSNNGCGFLLKNNSNLKSINIRVDSMTGTDADAIVAGALHNTSVQCLSVGGTNSSQSSLNYPEMLFNLVKKNCTLTTLKIPVNLLSDKDYASLAEHMNGNTSLIYLELNENRRMPSDVKKTIDNILDRNFYMQSGRYLKKAGEAFDPRGVVGDGLAGTGALISHFMLANSSSVYEFADTLAVVELSMAEQAKNAIGAINASANSSASPPVTTTTTTDLAHQTTTTTTTTTTTMSESSSRGSESS